VEPLKLTENQMLQKRKLLAAKQANASFIEGFPEKFETIVGERGLNLWRSKTASLQSAT
jgi:ABC-type transport system involved in Fe-S cluster assembly fused permease/ATPase subunit